MKTGTILVTLAVPATALGLFAQQNVTIMQGSKNADEAVMMAQGPVGVIGLSSQPVNYRFMTQEFSLNGRTVTNQPYSADEKTESVQTLADGTRITNTTTSRVYRDSQGRTRREMQLPGLAGDQPNTMITIMDPVAGATYTLDPENKIAHKMQVMTMAPDGQVKEAQLKEFKLKAEAESRAISSGANLGPGIRIIRREGAMEAKHEDLGSNLLEGVNATGSRETSTIATGEVGNDRPMTITSERWYSPELQIELKSVHSDPRMGQTTHTVTNISRAEPDPALFQVPPDYKLDESKAGAIRKFDFHQESSRP